MGDQQPPSGRLQLREVRVNAPIMVMVTTDVLGEELGATVEVSPEVWQRMDGRAEVYRQLKAALADRIVERLDLQKKIHYTVYRGERL